MPSKRAGGSLHAVAWLYDPRTDKLLWLPRDLRGGTLSAAEVPHREGVHLPRWCFLSVRWLTAGSPKLLLRARLFKHTELSELTVNHEKSTLGLL